MLRPLIWLLDSSHITVQAEVPGNSDKEILASYAQSGGCMYFFPGGGGTAADRDEGERPCKTYCEKKGKDVPMICYQSYVHLGGFTPQKIN